MMRLVAIRPIIYMCQDNALNMFTHVYRSECCPVFGEVCYATPIFNFYNMRFVAGSYPQVAKLNGW